MVPRDDDRIGMTSDRWSVQSPCLRGYGATETHTIRAFAYDQFYVYRNTTLPTWAEQFRVHSLRVNVAAEANGYARLIVVVPRLSLHSFSTHFSRLTKNDSRTKKKKQWTDSGDPDCTATRVHFAPCGAHSGTAIAVSRLRDIGPRPLRSGIEWKSHGPQ